MINIKVDSETVFSEESAIKMAENAKFYFGNTGSDKKSADVAVSNFDLATITPMPSEVLPREFRVQEFDHALDITRIPSTKTKLGFEIQPLKLTVSFESII